MTTALLWFSGSGNSLATAQILQKKLSGEIALFRIPLDDSFVAATYDTIVVLFPVYAWGYPRIVGQCIDSLQLPHKPFTAAVVTYGGGAGNTLKFTKKKFEKSGLSLDAGFQIHLPENYPPFGGAPKAEKIKALLDKAPDSVAEMAAKIDDKVKEFPKTGMISSLFGPLAYWFFAEMGLPRAGKKFSVNDACTSCKICYQICPTQNITMEDGRPVFGLKCEQCFACFHWCPASAIQYGKTEKQLRYHHPEAKLSSFVRR